MERINAEPAENTELAEKSGSEDPPLQGEKSLLCKFGSFGRVELHGADDAFAFFDEDDLIGLDVFERFDEAAGPPDFEEFDVFGFADAEVDAKIVLRKIAAAAADFVNLRIQLLVAGEMCDAFDARADPAAIGFRADSLDLDPIIRRVGIAAQKLGEIVDGVDHDIEVAVIVEVTESTATCGDRRRDSGAGVIGNIVEAPVAQIFV